ncbi:MAG: hypothetical protein ACPLZC_01040 [Candidatus Bathyarchaeales archaeon]
MRRYKFLGMILTLPILIACVTIAKAQTTSEMETFFQKEYAGLSIIVNATAETVPGGNLTTKIWINCTAEGVTVECFNISLYGFKGGQEGLLLNYTCLLKNTSLNFNETRAFNLFIGVPPDVWGRTQAELYLQYSIGSDHFLREPAFSLTNVRNTYYEKLQEDFMNLNETYWQTKNKLEELNQTYINLQQEYATLSQTYMELLQNYTKLQGNIVELDNTRRLAVVLGVTTVFFLATTFYLVMRKPKQYW